MFNKEGVLYSGAKYDIDDFVKGLVGENNEVGAGVYVPGIGVFSASKKGNAGRRARTAMIARLGQLSQMRYIDCRLIEVPDRLDGLARAIEAINFECFSDVQIYKTIFEIYSETFGRKFLSSAAVKYPGSPNIDPMQIVRSFDERMLCLLKTPYRIKSACRTYLYGNMKDSAVRRAIAAKYPPAGKITLREFHLLVAELESVGLDGSLPNVLSRANITGVLVREELLDKPLDFMWLCSAYNMMKNALIKTPCTDVGSCDAVLREIFNFGISDYKSIEAQDKYNAVSYRLLVKQLMQKYSKWSADDYNRWLASSYEDSCAALRRVCVA